MKPLLLGLVAFTLLACNQNQSPKEQKTPQQSEEVASTAPPRVFPKSIGPLFEAHGGIAQWDRMNNLCFEIDKASGGESILQTLRAEELELSIRTG